MQIQFGDCLVDTAAYELRRDGDVVALEPQVYDLLVYLIENRGRTVSKDEIFDAVWNGRIVSETTLSSRLKDVRKAVGDTGNDQRIIRTFRNRGLRFVAEVDHVSENPKAGLPSVQPPSPAGRETLFASPAIAVLPFRDLSVEGPKLFLSDAIVADLIAMLARVKWLRVIAQSSSFGLRETKLTLPELGATLGVDYLVEGTIRLSNERIRIQTSLAAAATGQHLWSETYESELRDLFVLQDDIVRRVVAALEPALGRLEREAVKVKPPESLGSWECYHRANWHLFSFTNDSLKQAERWFARAIALDDSLAPAHAGLANVFIQQSFYGDPADRKMMIAAAIASAARAVQLDDQDAHCHYVYSRSLALDKRSEEAIAEAEAALALNPSSAHAYFALGWAQVNVGQEEAAIENLRKAANWSPHDPHLSTVFHMWAMAHHRLGDLREAENLARKAMRQPNATFWPCATLCAVLGELEDIEAAKATCNQLTKMRPNYSCELARQDFFFTDTESYVDRYTEGLRKAGVPER